MILCISKAIVAKYFSRDSPEKTKRSFGTIDFGPIFIKTIAFFSILANFHDWIGYTDGAKAKDGSTQFKIQGRLLLCFFVFVAHTKNAKGKQMT